MKAMMAFIPAVIIASIAVWLPEYALDGFAWLIGASLGAIFYYGMSCLSKT